MISNRLKNIISLVDENSIVADIGTDHGYVPVYLIEGKIAKRVIGSDVSKGSLDKIINYVSEKGLEDFIDTRLGNGLEVIKPFEVDTAIIAGMGGILIREILEKDINLTKSITNLILQPMICAKELRYYLINNGFEIVDEVLLKEDGKYYEIIKARVGKQFIEKDIYYEVPKILIDRKDPLLLEYLIYKIEFSKKILKEIENTDSEKVKMRVEELENNISSYKEVVSYVKS